MTPDALALLDVRERASARGLGVTMHLRTGVTRAGLVWVAMNRDEAFVHVGATLVEACQAWLEAHPAPDGEA